MKNFFQVDENNIIIAKQRANSLTGENIAEVSDLDAIKLGWRFDKANSNQERLDGETVAEVENIGDFLL